MAQQHLRPTLALVLMHLYKRATGAQLAKASIDVQFVALTADVFGRRN